MLQKNTPAYDERVIIGIPKEIKDNETRVALLPDAVGALLGAGHRVLLQRGAGESSGFSDAEYRRVGAKIIATAQGLYRVSDLVVKVKEPLPEEHPYFRRGLRLFCYLHLAANFRLATALMQSRVEAFAFETLEDKFGGTPLLRPMSEIAGRLSVLLGAHYLQKNFGGRGVLLPPTHFSPPGKVTIVGGGSVGRAAAEVAAGLGARVIMLDINTRKLAAWARKYSNLKLEKANPQAIARHMSDSDLVVGAIYVHGARTPQVIRQRMVQKMPKGSVLMDVAVDQGGAAETTRPTSISEPVYLAYGVVHSAITNLPALVGRTASQALSGVILPYVLRLARKKDFHELRKDRELWSALNIAEGRIVHPKVQSSLRVGRR